MTALPEKYRFGPYEVRTRTRELFKYGTRLKLRPQPFQVLQVLVERAGDVVTREELRQMLWPGETFVDFEHGLNTSVKELRRALSDSASEPRYIETLPKLGYRIMGTVEAEAAPPAVLPMNGAPPEAAVPVAVVTSKLPREGARKRLYVAMAATVAAILGSLSLIYRPAAPETSTPVPLTGLPGLERTATWSPDGRQLAFAWNGEKQEHFDVYVMQPGSRNMLRLTREAGNNLNPAWSPDGKWIAYVSRESGGDRCSLNLVSPQGGPARTVLASETAMGRVSWLPDGHAVVLEIIPRPQQPAALWVVWLKNGGHRALTSPPGGIPGDTAPAVSPDGRSVAFCRATLWRTAELYLLDLKPDLSPAGPERRVTDLGYAASPAWTPDGRDIIFSVRRGGAGLWRVERGGRRLRPIAGTPANSWQPALVQRPDRHTSLVFSVASGETSILRFSMERPQEAGVEIAPSNRSQGCPRYSADGKRLAFSSDRTGSQEIWVANADGSWPIQLTDLHHRITEAPDWSPSGQEIAFVSQDRADRQIYIVSASGGPATVITNEEGILAGGGWSRDGKAYYYTSKRSGQPEVWRAPLAGGQPQQVTKYGGVCGFETAQGAFYYWKGEVGKWGVLMRRTAGGDRLAPNAPEGISCRTAPSPKGFYFRSFLYWDVSLYDETAERSVRVFPRPEEPGTWFTVSADGQSLAFDSAGKRGDDLMLMDHFR